MERCECGQEKITIAVGDRKNFLGGRPVVLHYEDYKRYGSDKLYLHHDPDSKDYVKREDGTRYGFNIAREIAGLAPGHQGMTADEEIVTYRNGNTLDLRRCNLEVVFAGEQNRKPAEYGSPEHISTYERPTQAAAAAGARGQHAWRKARKADDAMLALWNREAAK